MSNLPLKGAITDEKLEIIENGGVIIDGDKILEVGKFSDLAKKEKNIFEIDFQSVLVPGFIDCHTISVTMDQDRKNIQKEMQECLISRFYLRVEVYIIP